MKRSYLFIGYEPSIKEELTDFILNKGGKIYFANSREESIDILTGTKIDTVILLLHKLRDAAILKYINQYYPEIKVLISATKEYDDIINVFNKGSFSILNQPLKLKELSSFIK